MKKLVFSSVSNAIQYLSDITKKRIKVAYGYYDDPGISESEYKYEKLIEKESKEQYDKWGHSFFDKIAKEVERKTNGAKIHTECVGYMRLMGAKSKKDEEDAEFFVELDDDSISEEAREKLLNEIIENMKKISKENGVKIIKTESELNVPTKERGEGMDFNLSFSEEKFYKKFVKEEDENVKDAVDAELSYYDYVDEVSSTY